MFSASPTAKQPVRESATPPPSQTVSGGNTRKGRRVRAMNSSHSSVATAKSSAAVPFRKACSWASVNNCLSLISYIDRHASHHDAIAATRSDSCPIGQRLFLDNGYFLTLRTSNITIHNRWPPNASASLRRLAPSQPVRAPDSSVDCLVRLLNTTHST